MQNKKGISLIVLVITIIVMIILAAAVIIALDNSGIISKANKAVGNANLDQVQYAASLIWADAYLDSENITESYIREELGKQGITTDNYDIIVEDNGVTVKEKDSGSNSEKGNWKLEIVKAQDNVKVISAKVTNGVDTLDVGTIINYMPEGVGPDDAKYTGGWKILGVDDNGRLLIMSTSWIGDRLDLLEENGTIESYENVLATLQRAVDDYKDGTIGVKVRSVKVEDIDTLTGFDKTTHENGEIWGYGNKVTYSWNGKNEKPTYSCGTTNGELDFYHSSGFSYYDEKTGKVVRVPYVSGQSGEITEVENNWYKYYIPYYIDESIPAYSLIADGYSPYWLASRCIGAGTNGAIFGIFEVNGSHVRGDEPLFESTGNISSLGRVVRAVVTLAAGVELTESKTVAGTYDVKLSK